MSFCIKCGQRLMENEVHNCTVSNANESMRKFDKQLIITLLKNPLISTKLSHSDISYGILAIISSIVGFFIWALVYISQIQASVESAMGRGFMGAMVQNVMHSSVDHSSIRSNMFWIGFVSILLALGSIWIFGYFLGSKKPTFKTVIGSLGSTQWVFGLGFLVTGMIAFISLKLSILCLFIVALCDLVFIEFVGLELFQVSKNRYLSVVGCSIASYMILFALILGSIINSIANSLIGGLLR